MIHPVVLIAISMSIVFVTKLAIIMFTCGFNDSSTAYITARCLQLYSFSGEASPTIWSCYANISVFIDCNNNQF